MASVDDLHPDVVAQLAPDVQAGIAYRAGQGIRNAAGSVAKAIPGAVAGALTGGVANALPSGLVQAGGQAIANAVPQAVAGARDFVRGAFNQPPLPGAVAATTEPEAAAQQDQQAPAVPPVQQQQAAGGRAGVSGSGGGGGYGIAAGQKMAADADTHAREANEQNYLANRDAAKAAADLGEQKAAAQAAYGRRQQVEVAAQAAQDAEHEKGRQAAATQHLDKMAQLQQKVDAGKIDFNRMFKKEDGSTDYGSSVLATLSIAFGAFGQALTHGGSNGALDIINQKIDRDVNEQKAALEKSKDAVGAESNLWAEARQQFHDDRAAEAAAKNVLIQKHMDELKQLNNEYAAPERQIQFQQTDAALQNEKAKNDQIIAQSAVTNYDKTVAQRMQAEGLGIQRESANASMIAAQAKAAKANSAGGNLSNEQKKQMSNIDAALTTLDADKKPGALASFFTKHAPFVMTDAKMYDTAQEGRAQVVGSAIQNGVLTSDEQKVWRNALPSSDDSEETERRKKKILRNMLINKRDAILAGPGAPAPQNEDDINEKIAAMAEE